MNTSIWVTGVPISHMVSGVSSDGVQNTNLKRSSNLLFKKEIACLIRQAIFILHYAFLILHLLLHPKSKEKDEVQGLRSPKNRSILWRM